LRKVFHWIFALLVSSMIYAIVHFLEPAPALQPITWLWTRTASRMLHGFANWHAIIPGFFNLTLAGAVLALAYQRTGNLYFSIGLHAGWIFWVKTYGVVARLSPDASEWLGFRTHGGRQRLGISPHPRGHAVPVHSSPLTPQRTFAAVR
jgi:membrane protease YdiL (CAAX protease family)